MFIYALDRISNLISSEGYTANGSGPPPEQADDSEGVVYSQIRASDHLQSAIGTNKQGVVVFLHVNEGVRYRLGSVKITGARLFSPEEIRGMLSVRSGDICDFVAIASGDRVLKRLIGIEVTCRFQSMRKLMGTPRLVGPKAAPSITRLRLPKASPSR
jgi:outer membrane protein assembly factor BamA